MKKTIVVLMMIVAVFAVSSTTVFAENTATHGTITGKTVIFGLTSLLLWPGIGQYLNNNQTKKNVTHAVAGLFPPFRLWSGWDALVARQGGRWDGKL